MSVTILLVLGTVAILAAAGYFLLWSDRHPEEVELHYFRCPECGQKMRYAAARAGRNAICPRCKRHSTLPATPQPLAKADAVAAGSVRGRGLVLRRTMQA